MNKLLSNYFGVSLNIPALFLNLDSWIFGKYTNMVLTIVISLLAIAWWILKIYGQYLEIKKRKQEL